MRRILKLASFIGWLQHFNFTRTEASQAADLREVPQLLLSRHWSSETMAKTDVLIAALLLVSVLNLAEASQPLGILTRVSKNTLTDVENRTLNLIVRNLAQGSVHFQLLNQGQIRSRREAVVHAHTGQEFSTGPMDVSPSSPKMLLAVTVKTHTMRRPMRKLLQIDLLELFEHGNLKSTKRLAFTAVESWRLKSGKYLVIQNGNGKVVLSFKV